MARRSHEIGVVTSNVTTYADTSLSAATQYRYRVRAYNATGPSAFAGPASATTHAGTTVTPPSAPTGLVATRQSGRITLTWTDSSNNETGFSIERSPDGHAFSQIATVAQNVSTYVDTSPGSSKFVFYRVRAFNLAGNSAYTNALKVRNQLMRRKEGVMRYVNIAMAAIAALHLFGAGDASGRSAGFDLFDYRSRVTRRWTNQSDGDQQPRGGRWVLRNGRWSHESFLVHRWLPR